MNFLCVKSHFTKWRIFLLISLLSVNQMIAQDSKPIEAEVVIDSILFQYANLPTYQDSVRIRFEKNEEVDLIWKSYSQLFIRPTYFEVFGKRRVVDSSQEINTGFYHNEAEGSSLAWVKRGVFPMEFQPCSLNSGIARTVGSFGTSANLIPRLLLPGEVDGSDKLMNYKSAERLADEVIRDEDCFVLRLIFEDKLIPKMSSGKIRSNIIYWVRKKDYYILKYQLSIEASKINQIEIADFFPFPTNNEIQVLRKFEEY